MSIPIPPQIWMLERFEKGKVIGWAYNNGGFLCYFNQRKATEGARWYEDKYGESCRPIRVK